MESCSRPPEATTARRLVGSGAATPPEAAASIDEMYDEIEARLDNLAEYLGLMDAAMSRLEASLAGCAAPRPAPAQRTSSAVADAAESPRRPKRRRRTSAAARRKRARRGR
jgi:hypothetical protein